MHEREEADNKTKAIWVRNLGDIPSVTQGYDKGN